MAKNKGQRAVRIYTESPSQWRSFRTAVSLTLGALLILIVALAFHQKLAGNKPLLLSAAQILAQADRTRVNIPLARLEPKVARFFEVVTPRGTLMRVIAARTAQGFQVALDACEPCFNAHMGYAQRGDRLVCRHCGKSLPLDRLGIASAGCNPIALATTIDGDNLVLNLPMLQQVHAMYVQRALGTAIAHKADQSP